MTDHKSIIVGSVVKLKSDGPKMTVTEIITEDFWSVASENKTYRPVNRANCTWFEGSKLISSIFEVSSLLLQVENVGSAQPSPIEAREWLENRGTTA